MNTLLGDLTSFNDIQYPRYRIAFKLRKLQTSFLFQHIELSTLQDIFHSSGLQPLRANHELTVPQLSSVLAEIYAHLKMTCKNTASPVQLQDAHTTCFNWLMLAFQCNDDNKATVGVLKIVLTLLCGSKVGEKAKYFFSVLANEGSVHRDGMQYFCYTIQLLSNCFQEVLYPNEDAIDVAMSEALYCVRDEEDIEDEEEDGGMHRPFLSRFELVKVFTSNPPVPFLAWLDLWNLLPSVEKVAHNVKCSLCNKKTIVGFRYECMVCSNYHMCQMCFLKGRASHPHTLEHDVSECMDYTKSLKKRLGFGQQTSSSSKSRIMTEPREAPTLRLGMDFVDTNSISPIPSKIGADAHGIYKTSSAGFMDSDTDSPIHKRSSSFASYLTDSTVMQKTRSNGYATPNGYNHVNGLQKRSSSGAEIMVHKRTTSNGYIINTESPRGSTANIYSPSHTPEPTHKPTVIRIGNGSTDSKKRSQRNSITSNSSSDSDSIIPCYEYASSHNSPAHATSQNRPVIQSIRRSTTGSFRPSSLQKLQQETSRQYSSLLSPTSSRFVSRSSTVLNARQNELTDSTMHAEFTKINSKLSLEVDQLLSDLDPEGSLEQSGSPTHTGIKLNQEKQEKKMQINQELELLQDQIRQLHFGFLDIGERHSLQMPRQKLINDSYHERSSSLDSTLKSY